MSATRKQINWDEVKARLRESQVALDRAFGSAEQDLSAVFRERAAQLAGRHVHRDASSTTVRVLVFALGTEHYAVEFADVVELLPFVNCTPVPGGPPAMLGVINVHGEIRSVVDLGRLLQLPGRESSTGGYVLLVRKPGGVVAWRVDQVDNIRPLDRGQLAAVEGDLGAALPYLQGLTPDRVRLLNTEAILGHAVYQAASR